MQPSLLDSPLNPPPARGLGRAHREILRVARERDGISPGMAGRIIHLHRSYMGCGSGEGACCAGAVEDGERALKRLRTKGLMARVHRDSWIPISRSATKYTNA
jgi:hypothetical protein